MTTIKPHARPPPARSLFDTNIVLRLSALGRFFNMSLEKVPQDFYRPVSNRLKMFFIGLLAGWVVGPVSRPAPHLFWQIQRLLHANWQLNRFVKYSLPHHRPSRQPRTQSGTRSARHENHKAPCR